MKILLRFSYWPVVFIPILLILGSLGYNRLDAFLVGLTFIPCALLLRWLLPQAPGLQNQQGVIALFSILAGTFAIQLLSLLIIHYLIGVFGSVYREYQPIPVLTNPFFLALLLGATALGDFFWNSFLNHKFTPEPETITFISERHSITLLKSEILYIESLDSEVWIHTSDGRKLRNKTPITQWENMMGEGFIRIHRAFLVAKDAITEWMGDIVRVGEVELPVSRKYHDQVSSKFNNSRHF